MKPIAIRDILNYKFLSNITYAPGGGRAAFTVSTANEEENCYEQCLWLVEGDHVRQLTSLGKEGTFVWLDENRILFPSFRSASEKKRTEKKEAFTPLYALDVSKGGEALPLLELPFAVGSLKRLDDHYLVVAGRMDKRKPDLYRAGKEEREDYQKFLEEEKDYEVFDEIPFWFDGAGVTNGFGERLFLVDISSGEVIPLTDGKEDLLDYAVSEGKVYFAHQTRSPRKELAGFTLAVFAPGEGAPRDLLENKDIYLSALADFSGELLLFGTQGKRYGLNENEWVYRIDIQQGRLLVLRQEDYSMSGTVTSDVRLEGGKRFAAAGDSLYHLTTREGDCLLYRLGGDGSDEAVLTKNGSIDAFDVSGDNALLIALYDGLPQELYRANLKTREIKRISFFQESALKEKYVAKPIPLEVESEGERIQGWVLLPMDFDPAGSYPAVFDIHGGPKTVYGSVFMHEMQVWASLGYFVFFCNPTGSDGRDNSFADIRGKYGTVDYRNLMDFMDAVLERYPQIDRTKICETGGSYGGFMTNWIITHTDRFCCAASQRSISNWLSFWGTSDIGFYFVPDQMDADLYASPEKLWEHSPLKYAGQAKTPTLFIHSDEDYRCPLEQGLQMYTALVEQGVEARLCLFHGEGHNLSRSGKPKHRIRRLTEITEWFEKHTR